MNKLIFTRLQGKTAAVLLSGRRAVQFDFETDEAAERTGRIYIGKVKNIVKNIQAAFVEYRPGVNGYYSLTANHSHIFADGRSHGGLREGDEILVQIERAAVKTKDAVLSSRLNLAGQYAVLATGEHRLGISSKIREKERREEIRAWWEGRNKGAWDLIVRTNALEAGLDALKEETAFLEEQYKKLIASSTTRTCYSLLYEPPGFALQTAKNTYSADLEEIVTDSPQIHEELAKAGFRPRLYEDHTFPLSALYGLDSMLKEALSRRVWLKSGGYLVIDLTEAMTVIDVNTGKNAGRQSFSETILSTNLEAAEEIARQLRLRNLSGIIVIDFIDMKEEADREQVMKALRQALKRDPVPAVVVDMTALGLVEVTRKKIRKPLHEQIPPAILKKSVDSLRD